MSKAVIHLISLGTLIFIVSPAWLVWDHGQDLIEPPAHHPAAVPSHGLSAVCREGGSGTVPAAGGKVFTLSQHFHQSLNACDLTARLCTSASVQDANECWLQMVRVLQQKLEPLESETPMVRIASRFFQYYADLKWSYEWTNGCFCLTSADRVWRQCCHCRDQEKLHWPVFWCGIWNFVSLWCARSLDGAVFPCWGRTCL